MSQPAFSSCDPDWPLSFLQLLKLFKLSSLGAKNCAFFSSPLCKYHYTDLSKFVGLVH